MYLSGRTQAPFDPSGRAVVATALDAVEAVDTAERAVAAYSLGMDLRPELRPLRVERTREGEPARISPSMPGPGLPAQVRVICP